MMETTHYEEVTVGEKWEKCLAMLLPVLLLGVVGVHFIPAAYLWIELGTLFMAALVMGGSGAIGSYNEAFTECTVVLAISYFCGPMIGLGCCLLLGFVWQEMEASINLLLLVNIAARFMLIVSAGSIQGAAVFRPEVDWVVFLPYFSLFSLHGFISFFLTCSTFTGWMMSSFFRPVNE